MNETDEPVKAVAEATEWPYPQQATAVFTLHDSSYAYPSQDPSLIERNKKNSIVRNPCLPQRFKKGSKR